LLSKQVKLRFTEVNCCRGTQHGFTERVQARSAGVWFACFRDRISSTPGRLGCGRGYFVRACGDLNLFAVNASASISSNISE